MHLRAGDCWSMKGVRENHGFLTVSCREGVIRRHCKINHSLLKKNWAWVERNRQLDVACISDQGRWRGKSHSRVWVLSKWCRWKWECWWQLVSRYSSTSAEVPDLYIGWNSWKRIVKGSYGSRNGFDSRPCRWEAHLGGQDIVCWWCRQTRKCNSRSKLKLLNGQIYNLQLNKIDQKWGMVNNYFVC